MAWRLRKVPRHRAETRIARSFRDEAPGGSRSPKLGRDHVRSPRLLLECGSAAPLSMIDLIRPNQQAHQLRAVTCEMRGFSAATNDVTSEIGTIRRALFYEGQFGLCYSSVAGVNP